MRQSFGPRQWTEGCRIKIGKTFTLGEVSELVWITQHLPFTSTKITSESVFNNHALFRDIMEAYPDAKVLLSVRDPKKWYQSVKNTIYQNSIFDSFPMNVFVKLVGLSGTTSMIRRICYMPTNGLDIGKSLCCFQFQT